MTAVVSDDLILSKDPVLIFPDTLLPFLICSGDNILLIWSDDPSSQLKNHFIANCLLW